MNKEYIVLYCNDDGETEVNYYSRCELESWLNEYRTESTVFLDNSEKMIPWSVDGTYYMIIKGQVIIPKAKQVITKYEI